LGTRLYVGNLPQHLCFPELEDLFTPFGTIVSAELMTDPATGRSRGFGFVEMESADAARAAISSLNGFSLDGQSLTVNEVNASQNTYASRGGGGEHPPRVNVDRPAPSPAQLGGTRLFVGNLPYTATAEDLQKLFAEAGTVTTVSLMTDRETGQSKGFAFVDMGSKEAAAEAIRRFDGRSALGRILKVNEARPPERRPGGGHLLGGARRMPGPRAGRA
jgi:RNA recognition motif-containing protein